MSIRESILRRDLLKLSAAGVLTSLGTPWFKVLAAEAAQQKRKVAKNCILLWMDGGPSQAHTFDPKSKCQYKTISTAVPGIEVTEYLPKLAAEMKELALLRGMTSREGDHYRAKYLLHTGYPRVGGFEHPALGCLVSSQIGNAANEMPNFVTIDAGFDKGNGGRLYRNVPSYAGIQHAPLAVSDPSKGLENLHGGDDAAFAAQLDTLLRSERRLLEAGGSTVAARHDALQRALTLMKSPKSRAFNLDDEPAKLREAYGDHAFGKSCLMARRLIESGTRFVEIFHRGWDDHEGAAKRVHLRCPWMDAGMATLIADLRDRGMLDETLIVWMGEFGRSPVDGSGHHAAAWTTVLAGGGLKTGQTIGKTDDKEKNPGGTVAERPITVPDFFATICHALGIDPTHELMAPGERPMRLVEKTGVPLSELF